MTAPDLERAGQLRRMKLFALSLLLLAAAVYLVTLRVADQGGWGFVNAGAEAGMVGALADWFAVTALFRHPLGLPIPHTAIIPTRKDDIARNLQEFFSENFLSEESSASGSASIGSEQGSANGCRSTPTPSGGQRGVPVGHRVGLAHVK